MYFIWNDWHNQHNEKLSFVFLNFNVSFFNFYFFTKEFDNWRISQCAKMLIENLKLLRQLLIPIEAELYIYIYIYIDTRIYELTTMIFIYSLYIYIYIFDLYSFKWFRRLQLCVEITKSILKNVGILNKFHIISISIHFDSLH